MDNVMENMDFKGRGSNGKFVKGHGGYKKAGLPEMQRATRERLWAFFQDKSNQLPQIFEKLSDRDKAKLLVGVSEFFLPKQREVLVDASVEVQNASIDYTRLSPAALAEVLNLTTIHRNGEEIQ